MKANEPTPSAVVSVTPPPWVVGQKLDTYELQSLLHEGQASQIWLAKDTRNDAPLVLKAARLTAESLLRMDTERALLALLHGPHVPQLLGQGEFDGRPYLLMEPLPGVSLQAHIQARPLPIERLIQVACQLATALHRVHRQGALHLDLQPRHVMFRETGEVVLLSWGLGRHEQQPDLHENTLDLDNSAYLAPEQIQWQRHDLRSDLFSWAVVIYESLTRELPFGQPRTPAELRQRLHRQAMPPRKWRDDCPAWLQDVLLRSFEAAAVRHPNAAHLLITLRQPPAPEDLSERAHWTAPGPSNSPWWYSWQQALLPWLSNQLSRPPDNAPPPPPLSAQLRPYPLIMVLVDVENDPQSQVSLRHVAEQFLKAAPEAHLACVALQRGTADEPKSWGPRALSVPGADIKPPKSLSPRAQLQHWAHPLLHHSMAQYRGGASFHVIEWRTVDELGQWVQAHLIDHLIVGADLACTWEEADLAGRIACTVTVVPPIA